MTTPNTLNHVVAEQRRRQRDLAKLEQAALLRKRAEDLQTTLASIDNVLRKYAGGAALSGQGITTRVASTGLGVLLRQRLAAGKGDSQ